MRCLGWETRRGERVIQFTPSCSRTALFRMPKCVQHDWMRLPCMSEKLDGDLGALGNVKAFCFCQGPAWIPARWWLEKRRCYLTGELNEITTTVIEFWSVCKGLMHWTVQKVASTPTYTATFTHPPIYTHTHTHTHTHTTHTHTHVCVCTRAHAHQLRSLPQIHVTQASTVAMCQDQTLRLLNFVCSLDTWWKHI